MDGYILCVADILVILVNAKVALEQIPHVRSSPPELGIWLGKSGSWVIGHLGASVLLSNNMSQTHISCLLVFPPVTLSYLESRILIWQAHPSPESTQARNSK